MKKFSNFVKIVSGAAVLALGIFISCKEPGLGGAVDTASPSVKITYPANNGQTVIRDTFLLEGTCEDDTVVSNVYITIKNADSGKTYATKNATLSSDKKTWSCELNAHIGTDSDDESIARLYEYPDGNYVITAVAEDSAKRVSSEYPVSYKIDNTAPFLIITGPGVSEEEVTSPVNPKSVTPFGAKFKISGNITDDNSVSKIKLHVKGAVKDTEGNYPELLTGDLPEYKSISDGSGSKEISVEVADFLADNSSLLKQVYTRVYGDADSDNKGKTIQYFCELELYDGAKCYKGSKVTETDELKDGNKTRNVYINDTIETNVQTAKGVSKAETMVQILNGTYGAKSGNDRSAGGDEFTPEQQQEIKAAIRTAQTTLTGFSLNCDGGPSFSLTGFGFTKLSGTEDGSIENIIAAANQKLGVNMKCGLDGTYFNPNGFEIYTFGPYESASQETVNKVYKSGGADFAAFFEAEKLAGRAEKNVIPYTGNSVNNYLYTIDTGTVKANNYYFVTVSGKDKNNIEIIPEDGKMYGYKGSSNNLPPTVTVTEANNVYYNTKDITLHGTAVSPMGNDITSVKCTINVVDQNGSNSSTSAEYTEKRSVTFVPKVAGKLNDVNWTANLKTLENRILTSSATENLYQIDFSIYAIDAQNSESSLAQRTIFIDTIAPKIQLNSVGPMVMVSDSANGDKYYVNKVMKIKCAVEEANLKEVSYSINGGTPVSMGSRSNFEISVNTENYPDNSDIEVVFTAEDKAGNKSTYSTKEFIKDNYGKENTNLTVLQKTDNPTIELLNSDPSMKSVSQINGNNIFKSKGKLQASLTDDDGIKKVTVGIISTEKTLADVFDRTKGAEIKEIDLPKAPTSYTLQYELPESDGAYYIGIKVLANEGETGTEYTQFYDSEFKNAEKIEPKFCILISSSDATIKWEQNKNIIFNDNYTLTGKVNSSNIQEIKAFVAKDGAATSTEITDSSFVKNTETGDWTITRTINKSTHADDGSYEFTIEVTDKAGSKTNDSRTFRVDTTPPSLTISNTELAEGAGNTNYPKASSAYITGKKYRISASASDDIAGVGAIKYSTDSTAIGSGTWTDTRSGAIDLDFTSTDTIICAIYAADNSDNSSAVQVYKIVLDLDAPVLTINDIPSYANQDIAVSGKISEKYIKTWTPVLRKDGVDVTSTFDVKVGGVNKKLSEVFTTSLSSTEAKDWTFTIPSSSNGKYDFSLKCEDESANTSSVLSSFILDTEKPYADSDGLKVGGFADFSSRFFNSTDLRLEGYIVENISGVKEIRCYVKTPNASDFGPAQILPAGAIVAEEGTHKGHTRFSGQVSGFDIGTAGNTLKIVAVDNAGNEQETPSLLTVKIDQQLPNFSKVVKGSLSDENPQELTGSSMLLRSTTDLSISGITVDDNDVAEVAIYINKPDYGTDKDISKTTTNRVAYAKVNSDDSNKTAATTDEQDNGFKVRRTWTLSVPKEKLASNDGKFVYAVIKDVAGNLQSKSLCQLEIDDIAPVYEIKRSLTENLNGVKETITGTASDNKTISTLRLYYTTKTSGIAASDWKEIPVDGDAAEKTYVLSGSEAYNWSFKNFNFNALADGTTGLGTIYVLPVITDTAGNSNVTSLPASLNAENPVPATKFTIDRNADRPLIKLTNLKNTKILTSSSDAKIEGEVSDDDEDDSGVVKAFIVTGEKITSTDSVTISNGSEILTGYKIAKRNGTTNEQTIFNPKLGAWEFTPEDKSDGAKTMFFYIVDNDDQVFYTGQTSPDSSATTDEAKDSANGLLNPRLIFQGESKDNFKNNWGGITYKADSANPIISTIEAKYSEDGETWSENWETFSATTAFGGKSRKFIKFLVTANDRNGIKSITLKVNGTDITKNPARSTETSDSTDAAWEFQKIDLSEMTVTTGGSVLKYGSVGVDAVATDQCGMYSNTTTQFYLDNIVFVDDGENGHFNVVSPTANSGVQTGDVTINGRASDGSGSGIKSVKFGFVKKDDAVTKPGFDTNTTWYGNLAEGSSVEGWSFATSEKFENNTSTPKLNQILKTIIANSTEAGNYEGVTKVGSTYTLPFVFRVEDKLGNIGYYTKYSMQYNPNADWPTAKIDYPETNTAIGSTIRVTGSAKDNVEVKDVYLQMEIIEPQPSHKYPADVTEGGVVIHKKDEIDWSKVSPAWTAAGETVKTTYDSVYTTLAASGIKNKSASGTADEDGVESGWWGLKTNSSSGAWNINININSELNGKIVIIRACAVDNNLTAGVWTDPVMFNVDTEAPTVGNHSHSIAQISNYAAISGTTTAAVITSEKNYSNGMYLSKKGDDNAKYYLVVSAEDNEGIRVPTSTLTGESESGIQITRQIGSNVATPLVYGTDFKAYGKDFTTILSDSSSKTTHGYDIYIPIYMEMDTEITYTVTAYESGDAATSKSGKATYIVNIDNKVPTVKAIMDGNGVYEVNGTKQRNSNKFTSFSGIASDDGSGFDFMALAFKRTVGSTTTIELPLPKSSGENSWVKGKKVVKTLGTEVTLDEETGLYTSGEVSSTSRTATTFTGPLPDYVRKNGLIKIGGSLHKITDVSGSTVTFEGEVSTSFTTAYFPMAILIDNTTREAINWAENAPVLTITNDDGDGIYETYNRATGNWTANFFLDELDDGEVEIETVVFDKAENKASKTAKIFLANKTPRLAKIYLATDLNGDKKFTDNEFGTSEIKSAGSIATEKYYSALNSGSVQDVVNLTDGKEGSKTTGLTLRNDSAVAFEFVGASAYEGYGEGTSLKYNVEIAAPAPGEKLRETPTYNAPGAPVSTTALSSVSDFASGPKFISDDEANNPISFAASGLKGIPLSSATMKSLAKTGDDYAGTDDGDKVITLTIWDESSGTTAGDNDVKEKEDAPIVIEYGDKAKYYSKFGAQWTMVNIPVVFDLVDGVAPKPEFDALKETSYLTSGETKLGHVEPKATLPSTSFAAGNTDKEFDLDDKISGKIVFTGTVKDEKRIASLNLKSNKTFGTLSTTDTQIAVYNTTLGKLVTGSSAAGTSSTIGTLATNGYKFDITSQKFSTGEGHEIEWSLEVDSEKVAGVAARDLIFTLTAGDGTNTAESTYKVDVVPYITGIDRTSTIRGVNELDGTLKTSRSRYGSYSVAQGDNVSVTGFNFASGAVVKVGSQVIKSDVPADDSEKIAGVKNGLTFTGNQLLSFYIPAQSGEFTVTVNEVVSLNDKNNNTLATNKENTQSNSSSALYVDNRYINVWDIDHNFVNIPPTATNISTSVSHTGVPYGQYVRSGDGQIILAESFDGDGRQIFKHYDQPNKKTALGFDTKSNSKGGAAVMFFNENGGNSGTMDYNSSSVADASGNGGAGLISLSSEQVKNASTFGAGKYVQISGNPYMRLDSNGASSFYPLESYSMKREQDLFESPRVVKFGSKMHSLFYDKHTKGLKYSFIDTSEDLYTKMMENSMADWVVIDGGWDGQDRLHTNATNDYTNGQYVIVKTNNNYGSIQTNNNTNNSVSQSGQTKGAAYKYDILTRTPSAKSSTSCTITVTNYDYWKDKLVKGATIAFMVNAASRTISLSEINADPEWTKNGENYTGEVTLTYNTNNSAANAAYVNIYCGNYNVVGLKAQIAKEGATSSSSAGKYSAIDVTTGGYPVIAYYGGSQLNIAYATSTSPTLASNWTRITGVATGGSHVSMCVDKNNEMHVMYKNANGQLCYKKGTIAGGVDSEITGISFGEEEIIDTEGNMTYGTISYVKSGDSSYAPCVSYLGIEESTDALKYSVRKDFNKDGNFVWDSHTVPATSRIAVSENIIQVSGNAGEWTGTQDGVTTSDCSSMIGYQSEGLDYAFLKSEN